MPRGIYEREEGVKLILLKPLRIYLGMTQKELGSHIGLSHNMVSYLERGVWCLRPHRWSNGVYDSLVDLLENRGISLEAADVIIKDYFKRRREIH